LRCSQNRCHNLFFDGRKNLGSVRAKNLGGLRLLFWKLHMPETVSPAAGVKISRAGAALICLPAAKALGPTLLVGAWPQMTFPRLIRNDFLLALGAALGAAGPGERLIERALVRPCWKLART
jgi:hypothetical protein